MGDDYEREVEQPDPRCPECAGDGWVAECCQQPEYGECCGEAVQGVCRMCGGSGRLDR